VCGLTKGKVMNNLILEPEQWIEMNTELAVLLAENYGLDGCGLQTEIDENGDERYTERDQERFDSFYGEAENIMYNLRLTRSDEN
jgi:hypothetical protein